MFKSSHQTLSVVVPDQQHAKVWINDNYEGEAPVQASVLRNRTVFVTVKKEGFQTLQQTVQSDFNTTGILDAIGTYIFLLPVIGVASPGSHSLEETTLVLHLAPEGNQTSFSTNAPVATE